MTPGILARLPAVALLAAASCAPPGMSVRVASRGTVDAARELDQQGVRSFRDGRYADAVAYFRASYRTGGPSSELWNVARSRERMDDAEGAAAVIEEYLSHDDLAPRDRAEAEREAAALRSRASMLTVTTTPPGALVAIAGRPAGAAPVSVEVRAGSHALTVRREGYAADAETIEARFGRAVIVTVDLARAGK